MLHHYAPENPRRPVDWRWRRAEEIVSSGAMPSRRRDADPWLYRAMQFARDYAACAGDPARYAELAARAPKVFWAHELWFSDDLDRGNPMKSELEARILARDDPERVAHGLATTAGVIDVYERLFFNVKERLDSHGYIIHQVIGPAVHTGFQENDYNLIWKYMGYHGGPYVLDALVRGMTNPTVPEDAPAVRSFFVDMAKSTLERKALMAMQTLRISGFNAMELLANFLKHVEIERNSGSTGGSVSTGFADNIRAMLEALPIRVSGDTASVDAPEVKHYHALGVELPFAERIAAKAGAGLQPPGAIAYDRYVYPDPPPPVAAQEEDA